MLRRGTTLKEETHHRAHEGTHLVNRVKSKPPAPFLAGETKAMLERISYCAGGGRVGKAGTYRCAGFNGDWAHP